MYQNAFFDLIKSTFKFSENIKLDPSRVASNIASGIGFLGAGMIFERTKFYAFVRSFVKNGKPDIKDEYKKNDN